MIKVSDKELVEKYSQLKQSAQSRQIPFALTLKRLRQLMERETCYYTGVKFIRGHQDLNRSIDRVHSDMGYIDLNVVACTAQVNVIKSNLSIVQMKKVLKGMIKFELEKQKKLNSSQKVKTVHNEVPV